MSKKVSIAELQDSLGVCYAGIGMSGDSEASFRSAESKGAKTSRFVRGYIKAANSSAKECDGILDDLTSEAKSFERSSLERLKSRCQL